MHFILDKLQFPEKTKTARYHSIFFKIFPLLKQLIVVPQHTFSFIWHVHIF